MIQQPQLHAVKNDGSTTDVFRAALNESNAKDYYKAVAQELMTLLKQAQNVVVLNPAAGDLGPRIDVAIRAYGDTL